MITYPVSTKNAAIITGISPQALRTYTKRYSRFLSLEATPDAGQERRFTEADLRTLKFAYSVTATGRPHEEAIARLQAGELDSYPWSPPPPDATIPPTDAPEAPSGLMVPLVHLEALQQLADAATRREEAARLRADELATENARLTLELGRAEGKLSARYRAPAWWRALFGGSTE